LQAVEQTIADDRPVAPPPRPTAKRVADPLAELKAWRRQVARGASVGELTICSDTVLRSLLEKPPASTDELAARLGLTPMAAAQLRPLPETVGGQSSSTMTGA
jgi:hypothetical protein